MVYDLVHDMTLTYIFVCRQRQTNHFNMMLNDLDLYILDIHIFVWID